MSPSAREGYYVVIHFAADGSSLFVTIGCGSTIWNGGDLRAVSDKELSMKTDWARTTVQKAFGSLEPFIDEIRLGAKANLPRTFEKATSIAKRISREEISDASVSHSIILAVERLAAIYQAQLDGRDTNPAQDALIEVDNLSRPRRSGRRQGFGLSAAERRAIELRAMALAKIWLEVEGFSVVDVSAKASFDFKATRAGEEIKIEVKGTTSDQCDSILMTSNEVALHREEKGATGLLIVSGIILHRSEDPISATQGKVEAFLGWDIDSWGQEPIAYQIRRMLR
jgi:hypothetical protein